MSPFLFSEGFHTFMVGFTEVWLVVAVLFVFYLAYLLLKA